MTNISSFPATAYIPPITPSHNKLDDGLSRKSRSVESSNNQNGGNERVGQLSDIDTTPLPGGSSSQQNANQNNLSLLATQTTFSSLVTREQADNAIKTELDALLKDQGAGSYNIDEVFFSVPDGESNKKMSVRELFEDYLFAGEMPFSGKQRSGSAREVGYIQKTDSDQANKYPSLDESAIENALKNAANKLLKMYQDALDTFWITPNSTLDSKTPKDWLSTTMRDGLRAETESDVNQGKLTLENKTLIETVLTKPSSTERASLPAQTRPVVYAISIRVKDEHISRDVPFAGAFVITSKKATPMNGEAIHDADTGPVILYMPGHGIEKFDSLKSLHTELGDRLEDPDKRESMLAYVNNQDRSSVRDIDNELDDVQTEKNSPIHYTAISGNVFEDRVQSLMNTQKQNFENAWQHRGDDTDQNGIDAALNRGTSVGAVPNASELQVSRVVDTRHLSDFDAILSGLRQAQTAIQDGETNDLRHIFLHLNKDSSPFAKIPGKLRADDTIELDAMMKHYGLTLPTTEVELQELIDSLLEAEEEGEIESASPAMVQQLHEMTTATQNSGQLAVNPDIGALLRYLASSEPLFKNNEPPFSAYERMVNGPAIRTLEKPFMRTAGWDADRQATATPAEKRDLVLNTIADYLYPSKDRKTGYILDFNLKTPALGRESFGKVIEKLVSHIQTKFKLKLEEAVLAAMLLLRKSAPGFLIKNLPDDLPTGSMAAIGFFHGVALAEATQPGSSSKMSFDELLALPASIDFDTLDTQQKQTVVALRRGGILHYAMTQGQIPPTDLDQVSSADEIKAFEYVSRQEAQIAKDVQALIAAPPDREEIARKYLKKDHPNVDADRVSDITEGSTNRVFNKNIRMTTLQKYMSYDPAGPGPIGEFSFTNSELGFVRKTSAKEIDDEYKRLYDTYENNYKEALKSRITMARDELPPDQRAEFDKAEHFLKVSFDGQDSSLGMLAVGKEAGRKQFVYEILPLSGTIRKLPYSSTTIPYSLYKSPSSARGFPYWGTENVHLNIENLNVGLYTTGMANKGTANPEQKIPTLTDVFTGSHSTSASRAARRDKMQFITDTVFSNPVKQSREGLRHDTPYEDYLNELKGNTERFFRITIPLYGLIQDIKNGQLTPGSALLGVAETASILVPFGLVTRSAAKAFCASAGRPLVVKPRSSNMPTVVRAMQASRSGAIASLNVVSTAAPALLNNTVNPFSSLSLLYTGTRALTSFSRFSYRALRNKLGKIPALSKLKASPSRQTGTLAHSNSLSLGRVNLNGYEVTQTLTPEVLARMTRNDLGIYSASGSMNSYVKISNDWYLADTKQGKHYIVSPPGKGLIGYEIVKKGNGWEILPRSQGLAGSDRNSVSSPGTNIEMQNLGVNPTGGGIDNPAFVPDQHHAGSTIAQQGDSSPPSTSQSQTSTGTQTQTQRTQDQNTQTPVEDTSLSRPPEITELRQLEIGYAEATSLFSTRGFPDYSLPEKLYAFPENSSSDSLRIMTTENEALEKQFKNSFIQLASDIRNNKLSAMTTPADEYSKLCKRLDNQAFLLSAKRNLAAGSPDYKITIAASGPVDYLKSVYRYPSIGESDPRWARFKNTIERIIRRENQQDIADLNNLEDFCAKKTGELADYIQRLTVTDARTDANILDLIQIEKSRLITAAQGRRAALVEAKRYRHRKLSRKLATIGGISTLIGIGGAFGFYKLFGASTPSTSTN